MWVLPKGSGEQSLNYEEIPSQVQAPARVGMGTWGTYFQIRFTTYPWQLPNAKGGEDKLQTVWGYPICMPPLLGEDKDTYEMRYNVTDNPNFKSV